MNQEQNNNVVASNSQLSNNSFEYTSNQNLNDKCRKSKKIRLILCAVVIVITIAAIIFFLINKPSNDDNLNNIENSNDNGNLSGTENSNDNDVEENTASESEFPYTLIVNNVEYVFPLTYNEILDRGWVSYCSTIGVETIEEFSNSLIPAGSYGAPFYGGCGGMSIGEISNAKVIFDNTAGTKDKMVKDCDVIGIKFVTDNQLPKDAVSVKGPNGIITVGESTMDDVFAFFDGNYSYMKDDGFIYIEYDDNNVISYITFTLKA